MIRLLALAAALAVSPAAAQDATLVKTNGPVYYRSEGAPKFVLAKGGEELLYGDAVKTGPGALAHLALKDRGAVLLRENTTFSLRGNPSETMLVVSVGEFLVGLRHKLEKGQSFRVRTPSAVAAVRGTLFWGKTDKAKTTSYVGFGSTIEITARKKTVTLGPGEKVIIPMGKAPSKPESSDITFDYAQSFAIDGSLQDLETLAETPAPKAPSKDAPANGAPINEEPLNPSDVLKDGSAPLLPPQGQ